jgi:hypothetical protein
MKQPMLAARKVVTGVVALGVLTLGMGGMAGAASATTTPKAGRHFNCANATKALTRIQKAEADIAAGLPKLHAKEAKAATAGNTKRADRLNKRIARMESTKFKARLAKRAATIEAKCQVAAPSTTSGLPAGSVTQA